MTTRPTGEALELDAGIPPDSHGNMGGFSCRKETERGMIRKEI